MYTCCYIRDRRAVFTDFGTKARITKCDDKVLRTLEKRNKGYE